MKNSPRTTAELAKRYKIIADLWVAYHVHADDPAEFGREFYHAVGEILQGAATDSLELFHIDVKSIKRVAYTGRANAAEADGSTERKAPKRRSPAGRNAKGEGREGAKRKGKR